jgi:NADPH2:quinone reductase
MKKTIRQIVFRQYGSPEVLELTNAEKPLPSEGQVLIRVKAIGVNYSDILRRTNRYFMPTPLPCVLGTEAVGEIEDTGSGVGMPFIKGSRVLAILPMGGAYSDYVCADAQYCIPLPPSIDDAGATALFVQGSTAQLMVSVLGGDLDGKFVLINAAAGGLGNLLVQLAKRKDAIVLAATGSDAKRQAVLRAGADFFLNYQQPSWAEQIRTFTKGKGVDVVFEMVGGEVYNQSVRALAKGGHIIVYGCASGVQGSVHPEYFVDECIAQSGFNLAHYIQTKTALWQQALGEVIALVAAGDLKIETSHTFALKDAALAHRSIEARETTGKVVLLP